MNAEHQLTENARVVLDREEHTYLARGETDPFAGEFYPPGSLPSQIRLTELVFSEWRWFHRVSISVSDSDIVEVELRELTVEEAYKWVDHFFEPEQVPKELEYHQRVGIPRLVYSKEEWQAYVFDPKLDGWPLWIATRSHECDEYVFECDGEWERIIVPAESSSEPIIEALTLPEAADLFVLSRLEVPESLQPHRTIQRFKPRASRVVRTDDADAAAGESNGKHAGGDDTGDPDSDARARFVYECRKRTDQVSWERMEEVVRRANYSPAGRTKLEKEMREYCKATGLRVPKAKRGAPRKPAG